MTTDAPRTPGRQVAVIDTMGTKVSVDVRAAGPGARFDEAIRAVTERLRAIDTAFSPWMSASWVGGLIAGRVCLEDCPLEVQHVVELSMSLMEQTDGWFSPFWRPAGDGPGPDPTGLVKGWAAQQASDLLLAHGLPDHVVNAAGDVIVSGASGTGDDGHTWRVGIADPLRPGQLAGLVELGPDAPRWAVATSGVAELGAHVRDPRSGTFPRAVGSATVIARAGGDREGGAFADGWATALVAAGDGAGELAERLTTTGVGAFVIASDGTVRDPGGLLRPVAL